MSCPYVFIFIINSPSPLSPPIKGGEFLTVAPPCPQGGADQGRKVFCPYISIIIANAPYPLFIDKAKLTGYIFHHAIKTV